MRRTATVRFVAPGNTADQAWASVTADLACKHAIADIDAFRRVLAKCLVERATYDAGGGMARTANGELRAVEIATFGAAGRIAELAGSLEEELAKAAWPLADTQVANELRKALGAYIDHFEAIRWATKAGRASKKPKSPAGPLVAVLAHYWEQLTGEKPTAWVTGDRNIPGGRFLACINDICADKRAERRHCPRRVAPVRQNGTGPMAPNLPDIF